MIEECERIWYQTSFYYSSYEYYPNETLFSENCITNLLYILIFIIDFTISLSSIILIYILTMYNIRGDILT